MRRFLPVMFAVALSLLAQTPVPSPDKKAEEHPASPCRVGGRVVTAAEGSPLKSARVALVPEDSRSDTLIYGATSDSDGHFLLKEVVPGRYRFCATRAGFVDQQYQSQGTDAGAVLALKPGQKISDVLFSMTAAAVITGRVNNEDGEPMIRVQVVALRRPTEEETEEDIAFASRKQTLIPVASSQTDEKGIFKLKGIPPGSYVIVAYEEREGVMTGQARQKVEIGGESIESLTISLGSGATFQGRVTVSGPGSLTSDRISVALFPVDEDEQLGGHGRVKKDGTFEITSVKDGNYAIRLWGLEHDWYVKSVRLGADDILEKGLQLEKGASGGRLEVVVSSASAQVEGSVNEGSEAMIGAHVRITPDPETPYNRFRSRSAKTDQAGNFSITGLAPGEYRVFASYPASPRSGSLKSDAQLVTLSEQPHKTVQLVMVKPQAE